VTPCTLLSFSVSFPQPQLQSPPQQHLKVLGYFHVYIGARDPLLSRISGLKLSDLGVYERVAERHTRWIASVEYLIRGSFKATTPSVVWRPRYTSQNPPNLSGLELENSTNSVISRGELRAAFSALSISSTIIARMKSPSS